MRHKFLLLVSVLFLMSCGKKTIKPDETELISGETFKETVLIDGHKFDNLIIENCTFSGSKDDGLQIRDVDDLIVRNCTFKDIKGNAIRFRNSGSSNGVTIENNQIYNIDKNGILAFNTHANCTIKNNTIYDVGQENTGSLSGSPHHGIYFQGQNFVISNNRIYNVKNPNGNCISVRSYGLISKNNLSGATKHGVSYFSDHPGVNGTLTIENNFIYDNGERGINLNSNGEKDKHIGKAVARFNTIVSEDKSCLGVTNDLSDVEILFNGNILIRTDGNSNYIQSSSPFSENKNLTNSGDIGFVDFNGRDLHLSNTTIARGFASDLTDFPTDDYDSETRIGTQLEAGADELVDN